MARYPLAYQLAKDIDWFFCSGGIPVHVASAGDILPEEINDRESLRELQRVVYTLPYIWTTEDLIFNEEFLGNYVERMTTSYPEFFTAEEWRDNYLRSFAEMARRGFVSLDRTLTYAEENADSHMYHVVCYPKQFGDGNSLSLDLPSLGPEGSSIRDTLRMGMGSFDLYKSLGVKTIGDDDDITTRIMDRRWY